MLVLSLGLSQGELLGLEYSDMDFDIRTIKIRRILYQGQIREYKYSYQRRIF